MSSLDAIMDSDLDGKSNLEEFAFNEDPLDAANSGYSVSYSININNGDMLVHQLVPNYNHLAEYNFNLNAYISTEFNRLGIGANDIRWNGIRFLCARG